MGQPFYNPFLGPPPADPNDLGSMMRHAAQDPLMSLADQALLQQAPRRPGTTVTVEAYPVGPSFDPANHMYVQFDDGNDSYIYRGGPDPDGALGAGVAPAHLSRDYGKGQTVMYQTFLPDVSAAQAIQPAQADADRINRSGDPYGVITSNSNSVVGDFTARQYGHRVGDGSPAASFGAGAWTPGFAYDLPDQSSVPNLPPQIVSPF